MFTLSNFIDNDDIRTLAQLGPFRVIEYQRDLSVTPGNARRPISAVPCMSAGGR